MADVAISALPAVVTAAGTDVFPVVQAGTTKKETLAQALTWIQTQVAPVAAGGTGIASYTIGDLLYASGATTLAKLADVATGNALISGGVGVAPAWGKIDLTAHVSGILPSANGGTGVNNAGTLTNATNTTITGGGTLALGGFTLTVPATGTAVLLGSSNTFTAAQALTVEDAATNTTTTLMTYGHNSSGTPAASFGTRVLFNLESSTTADQNAAASDVIWTTATHASRTSAILFSIVNNAGALAEQLRIAFPGIYVGGAAGTGLSIDKAGSVWRAVAPSGNALTLASDGNEVIRIDTSANVGIGTTAATSKFHVRLNNATTAASDTVITHTHSSTGTPAAGFGLTVLTQLESSTTEFTSAADDITTWVVATHASRTARRVFSIYDTATREAMRMEASGTAPMIGFLGAAAVVRQTLSAAASDPGTTQTLANDLRTALINLGLAA